MDRILDQKNQELEFEFSGIGFVLGGNVQKLNQNNQEEAVLQLEITIDNGTPEQFSMPSAFSKRRHEIAWKYQLADRQHKVKIKLLNPTPGFNLKAEDLIVYASKMPEKSL